MSKTWVERLETRQGDEAAARKAVHRLYEILKRPQPDRVLWLPSPMAGLLAIAWLRRSQGPLFGGEDPSFFHELVNQRRAYGNVTNIQAYHSKEWLALPAGRRLSARSLAVVVGMRRQAQALAAQEPDSPDPVAPALEAACQVLGIPRPSSKELAAMLPDGVSAEYWKTFQFDMYNSFDYKLKKEIWRPSYSPRAIDLDDVAAELYVLSQWFSAPTPAWYEAFRELTKAAGWLWPLDKVAVIGPPPQASSFDANDKPHHESAPAVRFPDGWGVWSWHGDPMSATAVRDPERITPGEVVREAKPERQRVLIERRGRDLLNQPGWPEDLKTLARMVFGCQYERFEPGCLPSAARPWPPGVAEPQPLRRESVSGVEDGLYFSAWPGGQLRLVASIQQGKLSEWVLLEDGAASGFWHREWLTEWPDEATAREAEHYWQGTCNAQKYHADGRVEDFYTWDNDKSPTLTTMSFPEWVRDRSGREALTRR